MAPTTNARVLFASVPKDFPIPGETTVYDTSQQIDLEHVPLNGGFLIKTLVLSIDPYMRGRMRAPETKSYSHPWQYTNASPCNSQFNSVCRLVGYGVGVVLRSEASDVAPGKYVYGDSIPHQQYAVLANVGGLTFLERDPKLSWTVYVGAAGMPGKTAYMGWKEFSQAKKGETAFITTGAGPVGSMVIQLAKLDGLKVIVSAGSEEKVQFMKTIGADVAFNYKTTDTREVLAREGPIEIYWDNVGGDILDAALEHANIFGRFLMCGMISGYNTGYEPIKNMHLTFGKSLTFNGIHVLRLNDKYEAEFYSTVPTLLANGEMKYTEEVHQVLESVGEAILRVQKGTNTAKAVIVVAEE
ncbi:alcohol dehydrogenase [Mycena pura]|uniref:Alcohol dehydrogenase n=1 Tax=Mycena pura TaxID=153505 RepID=A0AAD6VBV6_9AGAR|nr:alcohol dehydrogenase [Mycena pura]